MKFWTREDSKKFYKSEAWAKLKAAFKASLPRGGKKCSCCSSTKSLQIDHIVPISKDPTRRLDITNLQVLCRACNVGKSNRDSTRMSKLDAKQRKEKEAQYKGDYYTKKWFSNKPTNIKTGKSFGFF